MTLLAISMMAGLFGGLATGGRLRNIEWAPYRWGGCFMLAILAQALAPSSLGEFLGWDDYLLVYFVWLPTATVLVVVALLNWRVSGMPFVAAGVLMNVLVVGLNGGMPVALQNLSPGQLDRALASVQTSWLHVPLVSGTHVVLLADVVPVPGPPGFAGMASLGDALLAIGVAMAILAMMHAVEPD